MDPNLILFFETRVLKIEMMRKFIRIGRAAKYNLKKLASTCSTKAAAQTQNDFVPARNLSN